MSDEDKPTIELYIKSSDIDKSKKGSCPLCHQWFMMSYVMSERGYIDFSVTVISPANLPAEFRKQTRATKFPVVFGKKGNNMSGQSIADIVADSIDEIEVLFESFGCRELVRNTPRQADALNTWADLYKTFNILLQKPDQEKIRIRLNSILRQINDFYESNDTKFLTGDKLTYADCALIPKLQHIKIAGREYCNYEIPRDLKYLWMYLKNVYESPAFVNSCPYDQDIIYHYMLKAARKVRSGMPSVQKPTYDFEIPVMTEDNGTDEPEDNGPAEPQDNGPAEPEDNGPAEPEDNGPEEPPAENVYDSPEPVPAESPHEPDSYEQRADSPQPEPAGSPRSEGEPDPVPNGSLAEEQQPEVTSSQDSEAADDTAAVEDSNAADSTENTENQTADNATGDCDQGTTGKTTADSPANAAPESATDITSTEDQAVSP